MLHYRSLNVYIYELTILYFDIGIHYLIRGEKDMTKCNRIIINIDAKTAHLNNRVVEFH